MSFRIIHGNIVKVKADAIVNAANTRLFPGGGVCGAIFEAAGFEKLFNACQAIGFCEEGKAVATPAFDLPAKYIIHTPGPIWEGGHQGEAELLASCYTESMLCALANGCKSIAFPLISAGIFGYPKQDAYQVARDAITKFIETHELAVTLVIFENGDDITGYRDRSLEMRLERLAREDKDANCPPDIALKPCLTEGKRLHVNAPHAVSEAEASRKPTDFISLDNVIKERAQSFSELLMLKIESSGAKPSDIYKRANIDRKLFSKIKTKPDYTPSKQTAVSFAIALKLDLLETQTLLESAGYVLSGSSKFDIIIEYYIEHKMYDIFLINEALFHYDQPLLGSF
ncbi:MAG: macro domain-containing protein [Proteobacteria bacterium]|nr:macro domain-containing protein [Pseudomonadota bacterium]